MGRDRVKRQQVAAEDGWTVITHGMGNVSLNDKEKGGNMGNKSKNKSSIDAISTMPGIVSGLTPEKVLSEFKMLQERWEDTLLARQIDGIFSKTSDGNADGDAGAKGGWDVTEAVCIGIGSFSRDWAHRWRSMWQLVLFVDVVRKRTSSSPFPSTSTSTSFQTKHILPNSHTLTLFNTHPVLRCRPSFHTPRHIVSLTPAHYCAPSYLHHPHPLLFSLSR